MGGCRPDIRALGRGFLIPADKGVEMFIYSTNPVLPYLFFPLRGRKLILENPPIAVESHHLAGLFFDCHLRKEVCNTGVYIRRRILIYIHFAVFVEIYPSFVIDFIALYSLGGGRRIDGQHQQGRRQNGCHNSHNYL